MWDSGPIVTCHNRRSSTYSQRLSIDATALAEAIEMGGRSSRVPHHYAPSVVVRGMQPCAIQSASSASSASDSSSGTDDVLRNWMRDALMIAMSSYHS